MKYWLFEDLYADVNRWKIICLIIFLGGILYGFFKSYWFFSLLPLSIIIFLIKVNTVGAREP